MNAKSNLKNLTLVKNEVSIMQREYSDCLKMAEKAKEVNASAFPKLFDMCESIYNELQQVVAEYKDLIAAVKSVPGNKGRVLQISFLEGKSTNQAAKELGYNIQYIRRLRDSGIKYLEEKYGESHDQI